MANPLNANEFDKDKNTNPEIQRPGEHGQPINPLELSQKVNDKAPHDALEANQRLQRDQIEQAQAKGTATANGSRQFEDSNGNKINGIVETRSDGTQRVYQDNGKGGWNQSQLVTDQNGKQHLHPLDNNGNPDPHARVTELRNPGGADYHQQQFAPPPEHSRPGQPPAADRGQPNYGGDTSHNTNAAKQAAEQYGQMSSADRQAYRDSLTHPAPGAADAFQKNAAIPEQGWRPTSAHDSALGTGPRGGQHDRPGGLSDRPGGQNDRPGGQNDRPGGQNDRPGGQNDRTGGQTNDHHTDQYNQPVKQNDANSTNRRPDDPSPDTQQRPLQGRVETTVSANQPGNKADGAHDQAAGKPTDAGIHSTNQDLTMKAGKAGEMQIDGKLLAQLNTFRMDGFADARANLAQLIGKFQDGNFHATGRDAAIFEMFKGMKPEQLSGLRNWLTDGTRFDFRSLDMKTQQSISQVFDRMLNPGDKTSGRMLDLLGGDKFRGFDRVPTGDQSRVMMMEFFKGVRDAQAVSMRDAGINLSNLISRNLLSERGDFKVSALDGDIQALIANRLQSRDLMTATSLTDRSAAALSSALSRPDSVSQLVGQIRDDSRLSGIPLADNIRSIIAGKDGAPITRGLSANDQQLVRPGDPATPAQRGPGDLSGTPAAESKPAAGSDKSKPEESGDARKKKEEEETATIAAMTQKQRMDKEDQQRKLEDEKDKLKQKEDEERLRKLEEEKRKEEEERRKQQEDQEFSYTVSGEKETLVQIAAKFSGRTAELIYARNMNDIMLKDYKGKKYAVLYVGQKLIIPNNRWIDNYRTSMQSYGHIGFDGIPFDSAADELTARFGEKWAGTAAAAAFGQQKRLFSDKDDDKPVTRRSFSGKGLLSNDERKENIRQGLGLGSGNAEAEQPKYTVKLGQQLRSIAQKLYGDPHLWRLLASKNGLSSETDHRGEPLSQLKKGQQLLLPTAEEVHEFRAADSKKPAEQTNTEEAFVEQVDPIELQEITLTDDSSKPMDFSPQQEIEQEAADEVEVLQSHTAQHPLPKAEYTRVEVGFEEAGQHIDPLWTARVEPLMLDQFVQILESEIYVSDTRGLRVSLQLLQSGDWVTIYDYEIFPDETLIHQYKRTGGRTTTRRSLPAKQTKQLASNHFQNAWQSLCREYWRS